MAADRVLDVLSAVSLLSILVPLFLYFRVSVFNAQLRILLAYLLLSLVVELGSLWIILVLHTQNLHLLRAYSVIELLLLAYLYIYELRYQKLRILWPAGLLVFRFLLHFLLPEHEIRFFGLFSCLLMISLSCIYFYRILDTLEVPVLTRHYFFWINTAVLFYFGGTIFISVFENFIMSASIAVGSMLWIIQLICNIVFHLLLGMGIWKWNLKSAGSLA
jgi:hypothetical protein